MKRRTKAVIGIVVAAGVALFFLAPVLFWFNAYGPFVDIGGSHQTALFSVYRSPGCSTLGVGVTLRTGEGLGTWYLSCHPPIVLPV